MQANQRIRGVFGVRGEGSPFSEINAAVAGLTETFTSWRDRQDRRIGEIEAAVNGSLETSAALRLGGGGGGIHPGAGLRGSGPNLPHIGAETRTEFMNALRGLPSASMSTQSDPDGGFTVRPEIDGTIDALMRNQSVMRSLARTVTIVAGNEWQKIVGRSGAQSGWVGEEDARTDTAGPVFGQVTIPPWELYAMPELTNHLLEDSGFDLQGFLNEDVSGEFALKEGAAFVSGDGVKKPQGFLSRPTATTADAARAFGTLQYVASGASGSFSSATPGDNLHDLMTALRPVYRAGDGVAWVMNSATANIVRKFRDGVGNYLWSASIVAGQPDRLLGYPVAIDEAMPDVGAGAFPVAFGNWRRGYTIVDKPGLRLIVDRVSRKGWTKLYFSRRTGGGVVDSNAIKLLKIAAS